MNMLSSECVSFVPWGKENRDVPQLLVENHLLNFAKGSQGDNGMKPIIDHNGYGETQAGAAPYTDRLIKMPLRLLIQVDF